MAAGVVSMASSIIDAAFYSRESWSEHVEDTLDPSKPVWILGKMYQADEELDQLNEEFMSRIWFTYRKNFPVIGNSGHTSDSGWGCMLRCGQMMLAQALLCHHLSREWIWKANNENNEKYIDILKMFLDRNCSVYSIHNIAEMGVREGKSIGEWFGPNTISQVIRKLVSFNVDSDFAVHVALDNTVVTEDIKTLCFSKRSHWGCDSTALEMDTSNETETLPNEAKWNPLILFIPLRLGLVDINSDYYTSLKAMFTLNQSLGVIGGKPNHAHYFVGFNGDRLLFLDPHTTQENIAESDGGICDETYHCSSLSLIDFSDLDPSLALGFYFKTEESFDEWVGVVRDLVISRDKRPMFEIFESRPSHWPPFELPKMSKTPDNGANVDVIVHDYGEEAQVFDSSGEYEII